MRGCGKITYPDRVQAQVALAGHLSKQRQRRRGRMGMYFCSECDGWHLGHRRPKPRAAEPRGRQGVDKRDERA